MTRKPNPRRIQYITRNPNPLAYDGSPITWACAKKMKEALHMLILAIWA